MRKLEEKKAKKGKRMSRQSISAEAFGAFNVKSEFKPRVIPKTPEDRNNQKTYYKINSFPKCKQIRT